MMMELPKGVKGVDPSKLYKDRKEFNNKANEGSVDLEARTVDMSVSSEDGRMLWFWNDNDERVGWEQGLEVLGHEEKEVDLSRFNNGAAILENHDHSKTQLGAVMDGTARVDKDHKLRLKAKFSRSQRGEEALMDIDDGIRGKMSVGYEVREWKRIPEAKEGEPPTYRAVDWMPYEASLVGVPADDTVGVGRSLDGSDEGLETSADVAPVKESITVGKDREMEKKKDPESTTPAGVEGIESAKKESRTEGQADERTRTSDILALAEKCKRIEGIGAQAREFINKGNTAHEFKNWILEKQFDTEPIEPSENKGGSPKIGLTEKEIGKFSIRKAILAMSENRFAEDAGFEKECSEAVAQNMKRTARGVMVPGEVMRRDLTVGSAASAGDLVANTLLSQNMIDLLRNAMKTRDLGATVLSGLRDKIDIPRHTGTGTANWIAEAAAAPEVDQTVDQVSMAPSTLAIFTEFTRKLMIQSSIDIEAFIRMDLAFAIALEVDRVAINGSGAGVEPTGILNTAGIGDVSAGAPDGGVPSWPNVVELETDVAVQNAAIGRLAYLTNSDIRGKLKTVEKATNTGLFVWPDPLMVPDTPGEGVLNGYRAAVSNQVPNNLVEGGSGATLSAIIFGNWMDLIIGEWGTVDIVTNPFAKLINGIVQVVAFSEWDIALRHPESFSALQDGITI